MTDHEWPNDTIESLMTTRAVRRFTDEPVSDDDVLTCLRAAQQAPSGGNVQPVSYLVVTDPDARAGLGRSYRLAFDRYEQALSARAAAVAAASGEAPPAMSPEDQASWQRTRRASRHLADHIGEAPVIVVFLQPQIPWGAVDDDGPIDIGRLDASVYPAVQNFMLAARSLGLGTALTTVVRSRQDEVFELLGIPADRFEIAAVVPVGHPAGSFGVARRRPVERVTHWNRWGERR